jgi:hypothetical protein
MRRSSAWLSTVALAGPLSVASPAVLRSQDAPPRVIDWGSWEKEAGRLVDGITSNDAVRKALADGAKKWIERTKQASNVADAAKELQKAFKALTPGDARAVPEYRPAGTPGVPSHCVVPNGCNACYTSAYRDLNGVRVALEKIRRLNTTTQAIAKKSLAFGDAVSGIHGVAGIAWQEERRGIEASLVGFESKYDAKYEELMASLEAALRAVGRCEAQHFNVPDWYDRYGYMYYSFMGDRYRR